MASGENFMASPLVLWVETFQPEGSPSLKYQDLSNGVYLNRVLQQIDPRPSPQEIQKDAIDFESRLHNWDILIRNIRAYYTDVLQQLIVTKMPNIQAISTDPDKDSTFDEVKKVILLILGCAVQCEKKEQFIENIKQLDLDVQHAIVGHIQEVTDDSETVLHMEPPDQLEEYTGKMFSHITRLIQERDDYMEVISELAQERDYYQSQAEGQTTVVNTSPDKHHLVVELAELKAKLRHLRQELEDKTEILSDLRSEIQSNKDTINKLRAENLELVQGARSARTYRDELDIYKEKASKVDKYECEIVKYKEKLDQLEFFKGRVEELRADNDVLLDTKTMLTEQLASSHKRVETVIELENDLISYRHQLERLSMERDQDRGTIQELTEQIAQLEFAKKNSMNESATLEQELEDAKKMVGGRGGSLSDQMQETANSKILRLELENQKLQQKVDEMKEKTLIENSAVNLELEKENQRLAKKVEMLQNTSSTVTQQVLEFESKEREITLENETLKQTVETVKENAERQVKELEQENKHLNETLQTLRERTEKTNDLRIREVEKENKRLHENASSLTSQVSKLDFENRQLQKSYDRLKETADKLSVIEHENDSLEKENSDLYNEVATLKLTCEKYKSLEDENSELDVENRKLCKNVETLQLELNRKEKLENDSINLTVENQRLQRSLEMLKNSTSSRISDLENEKEQIEKELQLLKKVFESQKLERAKYEQMEIDLLDIDGENQKINKSLESTAKRVKQLEQDNNDLEIENEKLQKTVENLKLSVKKLEDVERENSELDSKVCDLSKEKLSLEKENKKIKHSLESRESELDTTQSTLNTVQREIKSLQKTASQSKEVSSKVKELEKENKDIFQQIAVEKKTVATLREDLFNEKLRSQQLTNDLECLHQELEHIGIDRDKLTIDQTSQHSNRYQALESMMEETLSKNMQIKEEKIHVLESRLEESKNRNQKLQDDFRSVVRECESLKQRFEEDTLAKSSNQSSPNHRPVPAPKPANSTREILKLKDHLVEVERSNATLLAENKSLTSYNDSLNNQVHRLENQSSSVQSHVINLQGQTNTLQTENARLQVENTTLQSQCASFMSQVTGLQTQMTALESDHERLINSHEQLQSAHEELVTDHEALQRLHEQLTADYESMISEHGSLKTLFKSAKEEVHDLQDQIDSLLQGKSDVSKIHSSLEREREQLKIELKSLGNLQMDYNRLRDEHDRMKSTHDNLNQDFKDALQDLKTTKTEYNNLQQQHSELQGSFGDCKEQIHTMDMEMVKLADRCESMCQMNGKLEEENRGLILQVQTLLNQNQELLTRALDSKDHLGETEKAYLEKLADLRRQKEKLEEKIMEQYKMGRWDMSPRKKAGIGSTLVRKAKGLITRAHRSRSRPNLNESPDSSSVGSYGESTDMLDPGRKSASDRRKSAGYLNESSNLNSMNRSLAKSTTALNYRADDSTSFRDGRSNSVDDDGGFRSISPTQVNGRMSPGSKMMSLEEFLKESNSSPESRRKQLRDSDTPDDSESAERGGRSRSQPPPQPRRRAPQPPSSNQPEISSTNMASPPSISSMPTDHQDLNVSRMSRISASSLGSSSEDKQEMYNNNGGSMFSQTSTPKVNNEEYSNDRRRYNRPGSAVNDQTRYSSERPNLNSSTQEPLYASVSNLRNYQDYPRTQSKSPGPDYSAWNGRERTMSPQMSSRPISPQRPARPTSPQRLARPTSPQRSARPMSPQRSARPTSPQRSRAISPPRSSKSPGPVQQLFTNNLNSRNIQNYSSPNRPASALPYHGQRTDNRQYSGAISSPNNGQKPKSYTPQPVSRIVSAANINRDRSPQYGRPSGDYIHKPSPSYPPNYVPVSSPRPSNGSGDNRQSTPSGYGGPSTGRMTPTSKARPPMPDKTPHGYPISPSTHSSYGNPDSSNQSPYHPPAVRRPTDASRGNTYADVSTRGSEESVMRGLNGSEGQRSLQTRTQPVVLASRMSYPANGRSPGLQTPTARIQPQTKPNNNNNSPGLDISQKPSNPKAGEEAPSGPKKNSVWYEYGAAGRIV